MLILDTNAISELMRPAPEPAVRKWLARQKLEQVHLTAITEAELRFGAAILPDGRRKSHLIADIDATLGRYFAGRILPFDSAAAQGYAEILTIRRAAGRPMSQSDAQIAAIARNRAMALATRNTRDFEGCGLTLIDPWTV